MAGYSQTSGGDIGTLLRQIQEQKSNNPAIVTPGAETAAPLRGTVQTPVLNPESPGTNRTITQAAEGAGTLGQSPVSSGPSAQLGIVGNFRQMGGPGNGNIASDINMNNIPAVTPGATPTATPVEKIPTIPIAPQGAPTPTSFVQTQPTQTTPAPGVPVGTKIATPLPVADVAGQNRAETIVNFAQQELDKLGQVMATKGVASQEGQDALDRVQKLQAQLAPLATNAPAYLQQNLATLGNNISTLRSNAVQEIAKNFRQIPAWANESERAQGQQVIDAINQAEAAKAEFDRQQAEASRGGGGNNGGGGGAPSGGGTPPPNTSTPSGPAFTPPGGGSVLGASTGPLPAGLVSSRPPSLLDQRQNYAVNYNGSGPYQAPNASTMRNGIPTAIYAPPPSTPSRVWVNDQYGGHWNYKK